MGRRRGRSAAAERPIVSARRVCGTDTDPSFMQCGACICDVEGAGQMQQGLRSEDAARLALSAVTAPREVSSLTPSASTRISVTACQIRNASPLASEHASPGQEGLRHKVINTHASRRAVRSQRAVRSCSTAPRSAASRWNIAQDLVALSTPASGE